jgi:hypothetical protein
MLIVTLIEMMALFDCKNLGALLLQMEPSFAKDVAAHPHSLA